MKISDRRTKLDNKNILNDFFGTDNFNIREIPTFNDLLSTLENTSEFEHDDKKEVE